MKTLAPTTAELEDYLTAHSDADAEYPATITYPPSGFLRSYVDYAARCTDAPRIFHVACGLAILATAAGNQLFLSSWGRCTRLNLWVVLVAASSVFRKSHSITLAARILRRVFPERLYPQSFSVEALQDAMSQQPAGLLLAPELSSLWGSLGRDYNKGGLPFLMEIYDGDPYTRRTKGDGKVEIADPALTWLAGTTPDWLLRGLKVDDVSAGGLPRFLMVAASRKETEKGYVDYRDERIEQELADHLRKVSKLSGKLMLTPEGKDSYKQWERRTGQRVLAGGLSRELQPFYSRLQVTALKLAALYQLASPTPSKTVTAEDFQSAMLLVNLLTETMVNLFHDEVAFSRAGQQSNLIKKVVKAAGGRLGRSELVWKVRRHMDLQEMNRAIDTLVEAEEMRREKETTGGRAKEVLVVA